MFPPPCGHSDFHNSRHHLASQEPSPPPEPAGKAGKIDHQKWWFTGGDDKNGGLLGVMITIFGISRENPINHNSS